MRAVGTLPARAAKGEPRVCGVRLDPLDQQGFLSQLGRCLESERSHVVHFLPADPIVVAGRDPAYRQLLNDADLNLPDGMSVVWALRSLGRSATRLTGSDALRLVPEWGISRGARHFLLGGRPEVLAQLRVRLEELHPAIRIVGAESPPFRPLSDDEVESIATRISDAGADVVWIGLGAPKQERFAARLGQLHCAPVLLCVGAAFDFVAGSRRRAPGWMQRAGLEWLHRLGSEPTRLWRRYLFGNPRFVAAVLRQRFTSDGVS